MEPKRFLIHWEGTVVRLTYHGVGSLQLSQKNYTGWGRIPSFPATTSIKEVMEEQARDMGFDTIGTPQYVGYTQGPSMRACQCTVAAVQ